MNEESRISRERLPTAPPDELNLPGMPSLILPRAPIWTRAQIVFLAGQLAVLLAVFSFLTNANHAYVRLLWAHPIGLKMLTITGVVLAFGLPVYFGGMALLNRTLLRVGKTKAHTPLVIALALLFFIGSFLPALYVILCGPAAIQIHENMEP